MKKSEKYQIAMIAVLSNPSIIPTDKLEIIKTLMADKDTSELVEKWEEEK